MKKNEITLAKDFRLVTRYEGMDEETKALIEEDMDDLGDGDSIDCRRIKVPTGESKAFIVESDDPDDPDSVKEIEGVVIFTHRINTLWDGDYGGESRLPVCSSFDAKQGVRRETGEIVDCERCPYNQFAMNGRGYSTKACKNMRRIYMMMSGKPYLYLLSVPPTSMRDLSTQLKRAIGCSRRPLSQTVIRFTLVKATSQISGNTYNKIAAEAIGVLDEQTAKATTALRQEVKSQFQNLAISGEDYETGTPRTSDDGFMNAPENDENGLNFVPFSKQV